MTMILMMVVLMVLRHAHWHVHHRHIRLWSRLRADIYAGQPLNRRSWRFVRKSKALKQELRHKPDKRHHSDKKVETRCSLFSARCGYRQGCCGLHAMTHSLNDRCPALSRIGTGSIKPKFPDIGRPQPAASDMSE
ncbi:MAG: hypothetical protein AB7D19_11310 [Acetobacter sp.]|uniref:hypothetical protein n=1 Tax=Acetobacter sp. TaxID=440 RepID=UPI003D02D7C8